MTTASASRERLLFLTGKLAEKSLARVLSELAPRGFDYEVRALGITVAALMTTEFIKRRLHDVAGFDRVVLPGRCRGDLAELAAAFGLPFDRGPEELKDLPQHFGFKRTLRELDRHDLLIFAEIVDAPQSTIDAVLARAQAYRRDGADVIDVGCLPDTPFPALADTVRALKDAGFKVSVDSLQEAELLAGARAGADYLFSLTEDTLWIADEAPVTPVLIGRDPRDLDSLGRAIERFAGSGRPYFADPILDPIHHGFTDSILRYRELRQRFPDAPIMMGIGNLTELTHADTLGVNTLLLGIASELNVAAVLTTEVSGHCRSVVREIAHARRVMYAAREDGMPPRHIDEGLLALHERKPFPYTPAEIAEFARDVKDPNFRIQVSREGIHAYNRDGLRTALDPYDLFPLLNVDDDAPHAFYLGLELARAQIAWQLGKRYNQDEELGWGCVRQPPAEDRLHFSAERSTLEARKTRTRKKPQPR
jgi:dihydropteroate synthase-like protein